MRFGRQLPGVFTNQKLRPEEEQMWYNKSPVKWPSYEYEIRDYLPYFKGNILNAGSGNKNISEFIDGKVFNQDLEGERYTIKIHIFSPLEKIPKKDGFFDSIICNAVLEHVEDPDKVISEFYRVLKEGGYLYLTAAFMQPEHWDPKDFQRFTKDGLRRIIEAGGFSVIKIEGMHSVYHTLGWIVHNWLFSKKCFSYRLLRMILYPILIYKTKHSKVYVDSIASGYRVLAVKKK